MHLCLDMYKVKNHPQKYMRELGITYQLATPQSVFEQWWFWHCENVPKELPRALSLLKVNPRECIGWGLDLANVNFIEEYPHTNAAEKGY